MAKFICDACAAMGTWEMVESDTMPADDEHEHGWREPTPEEAAKAKTVTLEEHEETHKHMHHNM